MILISYDISNNKKRAKFSKFLEKFGHRIQYSVFEIDNSEKILKNIIAEIEGHFAKKFDQSDSVYIFKLSNTCSISRYGYAQNELQDIMVIS